MKLIKTIKKTGYKALNAYDNPNNSILKEIVIDLTLALIVLIIGTWLMIGLMEAMP